MAIESKAPPSGDRRTAINPARLGIAIIAVVLLFGALWLWFGSQIDVGLKWDNYRF